MKGYSTKNDDEKEILVRFDFEEEIEQLTERTIKLRTNEYIFDVNSLFLPFVPEYKGETIDRIIVDQFNGVDNSKIVVRGDTDLGVPTVYDKLTLVTLQKIFIKQKQHGGIVNFKTKNITVDDRTLNPVLISEIAKEMGYIGNISTATKAKICDSIRRLSYTTYVSSSDRTFNHKEKDFLMKSEEAMHLLKYSMITLSEQEKEIRREQSRKANKSTDAISVEKYKINKDRVFEGMVKITLDDIAYKAMACDQILYYKDSNLKKITNAYASGIYSLMLKLAGKKKEQKISFKKLHDYFPFREGTPYRRQKEITKRAIERLIKNDVCKISFLNNDVIQFNFGPGAKQVFEPDYMRDKFKTFGQIVEGFKALGLTQEEIYELDMEKQRYYEALLRKVTIKNKYNSILNVREYTLSYIKNEYDIDKKYYS